MRAKEQLTAAFPVHAREIGSGKHLKKTLSHQKHNSRHPQGIAMCPEG